MCVCQDDYWNGYETIFYFYESVLEDTEGWELEGRVVVRHTRQRPREDNKRLRGEWSGRVPETRTLTEGDREDVVVKRRDESTMFVRGY